ncbi:outer membrane beta-barrel protein [Pseudomonas fluorescens]|uniref:outer membrane beta-barrel protein n=1 Tax=Pseudomonas TaxID=286 RepID=UPI000C15ADBE|nr:MULTISPECIES: outer membrane beta-barrel protein [Pseudomonas]MBD8190263.1 outer membrane beta-barrel protein [Pseudomonas fluorescens]MBD8224889.1 outer membrane beta-barrel protein [Pseudomonas fluorescens]MBD8236528.1 outer membrane beta-barrel protein [Pseudomonas fluorescens]MBD8783653.1 outer membrane beta-barrel protein [Pseudomonas fluorescens]MBD8815434.1 outer membrane beta-barrel protein [Pseudomonas fluorescens]
MSKLFGNFLKNSSLLALVAAPAVVFAAPSTDPISTFGLLGSYNDFKLEGGSQSDKDHMPEAGLFYNFGNKLTAESGFIYQAGIEAKYGKKSDNKLKEGQADLDLGWRAALDARNFVDVIVGGGYSWTRYELDSNDNDLELTNKSPFAKAALGYNHQFDDMTLRVEAGARRTLDGRTRIKVDGFGSDTVDLKDRTNPYAEVSLLMNQKGDLPVMAGLYYTRTEYKLDADSEVADNTRLKRDEYGVKVGIAF